MLSPFLRGCLPGELLEESVPLARHWSGRRRRPRHHPQVCGGQGIRSSKNPSVKSVWFCLLTLCVCIFLRLGPTWSCRAALWSAATTPAPSSLSFAQPWPKQSRNVRWTAETSHNVGALPAHLSNTTQQPSEWTFFLGWRTGVSIRAGGWVGAGEDHHSLNESEAALCLDKKTLAKLHPCPAVTSSLSSNSSRKEPSWFHICRHSRSLNYVTIFFLFEINNHVTKIANGLDYLLVFFPPFFFSFFFFYQHLKSCFAPKQTVWFFSVLLKKMILKLYLEAKLLIMMRLYRLKNTQMKQPVCFFFVFSPFKCLIIASAAADKSNECKPEQNIITMTSWCHRFLYAGRASTIAIDDLQAVNSEWAVFMMEGFSLKYCLGGFVRSKNIQMHQSPIRLHFILLQPRLLSKRRQQSTWL